MATEDALIASIERAEAQNADLAHQLLVTNAKVAKLDLAIGRVDQAIAECSTLLQRLQNVKPLDDWKGKRRKDFDRSFCSSGRAIRSGIDYRQRLNELRERFRSEKKKLQAQQMSFEGIMKKNGALIRSSREAIANGSFESSGGGHA